MQAHLPTESLIALAFSGDGTRLATLSQPTETNHQAQIWDVATGNLLHTFLGRDDHGVFAAALALSSGGETVAVGRSGGQIEVWDSATEKTSANFVAHHATSLDELALAISPDNKILASGCGTDATVKLWELKTGRPIATLTNHQRLIYSLAFSPDGRWLASGGTDQTIRLWDLERKQQAAVFQGQWSPVCSLAFLPDGRTLASGGADGSVLFWDIGAKARQKTFVTMKLGSSSYTDRVAAFTPDSQSILALDRERAVVRWDCATALPIGRMSAFGTNNNTVLFSPSGRLLVVADNVGHLKVWDWNRQQLITNLANKAQWVATFGFNFNDSQLLSFEDEPKPDGGYTLWDVPAWRPIFSRPQPPLNGEAAWSPDGRTLVWTFNEDGTLLFEDLQTHQTQARFKAHQGGGYIRVSFSPDGKLLASAGTDGTLKLWDAVTRANLATMRGLSYAYSMVFAPNGRRIAAGYGVFDSVCLWDVITHRNVLGLPGQGSSLRFVQFSPDGNALFGINDFGVLYLWRAPSWAEIAAAEAKEKTEIKQP